MAANHDNAGTRNHCDKCCRRTGMARDCAVYVMEMAGAGEKAEAGLGRRAKRFLEKAARAVLNSYQDTSLCSELATEA